MKAALEGIRVVELSSEMGAFAGKLLADMGADVIVVEPPGGSPTRSHPPFVDDEPDPERSLYWWHYNTSKRGVTLDLDDGGDRETLRRLVGTADVLLECELPGRLQSLGVDYPDHSRDHAGLIHCSVTPFGRNGPSRHEHATDLTILARGGPVWSCGYDDHTLPPVRGGGNQGHHIACHYAFMSILTALVHREVSGRGQHVDVSAHAAANVTTEMASYFWLVSRSTVQRQTGRHAMDNPTLDTQFQCADGRWVTTGFPPRSPRDLQWLYEWVCEVGSVDEFPEAVFLEQGGRLEEDLDIGLLGQDDTVTAIFGAAREGLAYAASKVSGEEFFARTQAAGLQTGVVLAPEEALEDPHFVARGFPTEVEHEELGRTVTYPGAPYKFEKTPWRISRRAPRLGEHNEEILGALVS